MRINLGKLKVGAFTYDLVEDHVHTRHDSKMGATDSNLLTIYIDTELPKEKVEAVLLHEALHAMLYDSGIRQIMTDGEDFTEEYLVFTLANILYLVMKDNPDYFSFHPPFLKEWEVDSEEEEGDV